MQQYSFQTETEDYRNLKLITLLFLYYSLFHNYLYVWQALNHDIIRQKSIYLKNCTSAGKIVFSPKYGKICNLSFLWRKYGKSIYQNGWYGDCVEILWRLILLGDFVVKLDLRLPGALMEKTW